MGTPLERVLMECEAVVIGSIEGKFSARVCPSRDLYRALRARACLPAGVPLVQLNDPRLRLKQPDGKWLWGAAYTAQRSTGW